MDDAEGVPAEGEGSGAVNGAQDEDEDEKPKPPTLEAKDPFLHRPLPFVIGTRPFMDDDFIGLFDDAEPEGENWGCILAWD